MEFAVYRIFRDGRGRKMGEYVGMCSSREEAEELSGRLEGEHEVVGLWTREIAEDEDYSTVVFLEGGVVSPAEPEPGGTEREG